MWHNFRHHITPEKNQLIFPFGSYSEKNPNSFEAAISSADPCIKFHESIEKAIHQIDEKTRI